MAGEDFLEAFEARVGHALPAIRKTIGEPVVTHASISTPYSDPGRRDTFRIETVGGRRLKLRWVDEHIDTAWVTRALAALDDPRTARILCCEGRVLLEEWIDGTEAPFPPTPEILTQAGDFLGRLHTLATVDGLAVGEVRKVRRYRSRVVRDLQVIVDAGHLTRSEKRTLRAGALATAPQRARAGVIHDDVRSKNTVIDVRGHVRFIDHETVRRSVLDLNVHQTCMAWRLSSESEQRFLAAYGTHRNLGELASHAYFWRVVGAARSLRHQVELRARGRTGDPEYFDTPLAWLRRLCEERAR